MKKYFFAILILLAAFGLWLYRDKIFDLLSSKAEFQSELQQIKKEIFNPPPLVSQDTYQNSVLTEEGVIAFTNQERRKNGLQALEDNDRLDQSARAKGEDMIGNQYFAHVSPSGIGVENLVDNVGYQYIVIGENLAMGGFKNDQDLVDAWMASPGHRANILNPKYREIGVAVMEGVFNGETVWFAVQHFGAPLSLCEEPSAFLKEQISANQSKISALEGEIDVALGQIKSMSKWGSNYKKQVELYNDLVNSHNSLIAKTDILIKQYNNEVEKFNYCLQAI